MSLVPDDDRHPLHKNTVQRNVDLRAEFLLEYLILESIDERDPRITQPEGFLVSNLLGNNITFMMDEYGWYQIGNFFFIIILLYTFCFDVFF